MRKQSAYAKTKVQISFAMTAKLIRAFVFTTRKVQSLFFYTLKFQSSSSLLWLYSRKLLVFSCTGSFILLTCLLYLSPVYLDDDCHPCRERANHIALHVHCKIFVMVCAKFSPLSRVCVGILKLTVSISVPSNSSFNFMQYAVLTMTNFLMK